MQLMRTYDMQLANEHRFARAHIERYMRNFIQEDKDGDIQPLIQQCVDILDEFIHREHVYRSNGEPDFKKRQRYEAIKMMDTRELVERIIVASMHAQHAELFTGFCAKLAGTLKMDDKVDSIMTISEMIAMISGVGLFELIKYDKFSSIYIESRIELSHELEQYISNCSYLPPLVHKPENMKNNRDTPYHTIGAKSVILNSGHHEGDVCLDFIDRMQQTPLCLHTEFLCRVEEEPNSDMSAVDKQNMWLAMKVRSHEHYKLMVMQGNRFYLGFQLDRRGRAYATGYHISVQGSPYKKAMVEFANKEMVTGVPAEYML
ncbi:MAG: hypothetical protein DI616_15800 [Paracoccus denitrificans]|uniref:Uncharacterized protein n=1 Tax=Paracoccus denitrificans TaxID=266 RepID=A0A533I5A0_PARDE|nr:MAG: hypothetical protein DI616_15800 [Paracoccus denitrificans]